jgi:hypothetical protein
MRAGHKTQILRLEATAGRPSTVLGRFEAWGEMLGRNAALRRTSSAALDGLDFAAKPKKARTSRKSILRLR